jgi:hypothetical protein
VITKVFEHREAIGVRQAKIEQDKFQAGILAEESHRLTAGGSLKDDRVGSQLIEHVV